MTSPNAFTAAASTFTMVEVMGEADRPTGNRMDGTMGFVLRDFPGIEPGYCVISVTTGPIYRAI